MLIDGITNHWPIELQKIELLIELGADVNYVVPFDKTNFVPNAGKTPLQILEEYKVFEWTLSQLLIYDKNSWSLLLEHEKNTRRIKLR